MKPKKCQRRAASRADTAKRVFSESRRADGVDKHGIYRPGSVWRVLAQGPRSARMSLEVDMNDPPSTMVGGNYLVSRTAAEFDELVVDKWFHIERMSGRVWWMAIRHEDGNELVVWVTVGKDGRASRISHWLEQTDKKPPKKVPR